MKVTIDGITYTAAYTRFRNWTIHQYGPQLHLQLEDRPGYIVIKAGDAGFTVDLMPDIGNQAVASAHADYISLENDHHD